MWSRSPPLSVPTKTRCCWQFPCWPGRQSLLGFAEIIGTVYPIFGYISIAFLVFLVIHFFRAKDGAAAAGIT